ncbi:hypothetical protein OS493_035905 [Desmophyllum pertusum]|uniref:Uncharacterized protein n=1 Tax=Desmophyllum pertusum TaxID=174260 RepID=A0A9X0CWR6_9CNID|nr:hypothetical protein OS493_035905 [Desmophyllum pertusum]
MPRYYIQGILDEMTRDEKTLTELIKEQGDIKAASQRQRERLEDMIDSVKSKVGEDLVNALTSLGPEDIQPDKGKEYRAGIDEVKGNEATISDILNDLSAENKELRDMNGELSSDLEMLKAKIGEELVEALLSQSVPIKELEFGEVISAVQDEEETLSNILWEQKEQRELIDNMLGKDLLNSILRKEDTLDTRHDADSTLELMAPAIMRKYDEDLENVIAVYEKELDNLSRENDSLKETLGKDLSLALLQMRKRPETPVGIDNIKQEIPPRTQDGNTGLMKQSLRVEKPSTAVRNDGKSPPLKAIEGRTLASQESSDSDITLTEDTDTGNDTEKETKESMKGSDVPKLETRGRKETEKERDIHPQRKKSSSDLTDEEDGIVKGSLNAPTIMRENGNTLEEVIAQYESNLIKPMSETGKQRAAMDSSMTTDRFKIEKPDGISKVDETMQGIIDSQEKNMEMLRILKERLGDDLVYALIHENRGRPLR